MPAEFQRAQSVFLAAVETADPAARAALLDRECAGDAELRKRVEALLRADLAPDSILKGPALVEGVLADADATQALDRSTDAEFAGIPAQGRDTGDTTTRSLADETSDLEYLQPATKAGSIGRLGHYEILEVIGKGGFGTVFRAFDEKLHRVVAIKALSPAYAANGSARKRFVREARTAAAVKNEHVVGIYGVEEDAQPPYLAMEMIDGISLQDKLDKHGALGVKEILRIGMQMAEGLTAAHKQGLVHRDIKPANILLENGVERVKITDFGLARAVDDASVTQSGTVAGTPMYMSPEQAEGLPIDHRSDLFSLGTVLYAMCTGHTPFRASGTHAVLKRVIDASPRPIREINNELPDWLCDIIAKLHAKKPVDRFQSAKEVADLLAQRLADVQAGREIVRVPSVSERVEAPTPVTATQQVTGNGAPRRRRRIAAALGVVALLVAGLFATPFLYRYVTNQSTLILSGNMDPNLDKILVKQQGETVAELTTIEGMVHVPAGDYEAEVVPKAGFMLSKYRVGTTGSGATDWQIAKGPSFPLRLARADHVSVNVELAEVPVDPSKPPTPEPGWVQLFNGKNLDGWKAVGYAGWSAKDGVLFGRGKPGDPATLLTVKEYSDYELEFDYKLHQGTQGHVSLRTQPGGEKLGADLVRVHLIDSRWYEANLDNLNLHGALRGYASPKSTRDIPLGTWQRMKIRNVGSRVQIWDGDSLSIDHVVAAMPRKPSVKMPSKGFIGLFTIGVLPSGAGPALEIRNIRIKELPPDEPGWVQLFNGKDLDGWTVVKQMGKGPALAKAIWEADGGFVRFQSQINSCLRTTKRYQDYELKLEYRYPASRKASGSNQNVVMLRVQDTLGWPASSQVSLMESTKSAVEAVGVTGPYVPLMGKATPGEWNQLRIICRGRSVSLVLNGQAIGAVRGYAAQEGYIGIGLLGPKDEIHLRNVEIKELPPLVEQGRLEDRYEGEWEAFFGLREGKELSKEDLAAEHMTIRGNLLVYHKPPQSESTFTLNQIAKKHTEITLTGKGPFATVLLGIIMPLKSSEFRVCFGTDTNRPESFEAKAGSGQRMVYFRRIGPALKELPPEEPGWVQLFNGKDVTGWKPYQRESWTVKAGILVGTAKGACRLSSERTDYQDYHLRFKAKTIYGMGLGFRYTDKGYYSIDYSRSGDSLGISHGPTDPKVQTASWNRPALRGDEWFDGELIVQGPRVTFLMNGFKIAELTGVPVRKGRIDLIVPPAEANVVQFEKIEIKELPPATAAWEIIDLHKDSKVEQQDGRVTFTLPGTSAKRRRRCVSINQTTGAQVEVAELSLTPGRPASAPPAVAPFDAK